MMLKRLCCFTSRKDEIGEAVTVEGGSAERAVVGKVVVGEKGAEQG